MPFTPTHIIAILPLTPLSQWLPFSALAIGTMVPDTSLFFPIVDYHKTHSVTGVPLVCLPIGMTFFILFQLVMKQPLHALLPTWIQQRTVPIAKPCLVSSVGFYIGVAVAILIGAYSHLLWDAFSHQGRWGTQLIPALNNTYTLAGITLPGYKSVQYGSTFVGLPLLAFLSWRRCLSTEVHDTASFRSAPRLIKWAALLFITTVPLVVMIFVSSTDAANYSKLGVVITTSGASLMVTALVYSVVFQIWQDQQSRKQLP